MRFARFAAHAGTAKMVVSFVSSADSGEGQQDYCYKVLALLIVDRLFFRKVKLLLGNGEHQFSHEVPLTIVDSPQNGF